MTLPVNLILVRHGESEGNLARHRSKKGDESPFEGTFRERHSSQFRLTDRGVEQAKAAGNWLKEHFPRFDEYYASEYVRAFETAGHLGYETCRWELKYNLRERDWGEMDISSEEDRKTRFRDAMVARNYNAFFWRPPNGESLAELCVRLRQFVDTLHRKHRDKNVIAVNHGEVVLGLRVIIEQLSQERFSEIYRSRHPFDDVHNCQIIWYTRRDPETGKLDPVKPRWMKSVCPWDESKSSNEWQEIVHPTYTSEELLTMAEKHPKILDRAP